MSKQEMIKKLQDLRAQSKKDQYEHIKGKLKNTSSLRKTRVEIASILTKLKNDKNGI